MTVYAGTLAELRASVIAILRADATLTGLVSDDPPEAMGVEPEDRMGGRVYVGISTAVVRLLGRRRAADDPTLTAPTLAIRSWIRRQPDRIRGGADAHSYNVALGRADLLLSLLADPSLSIDTATAAVVVLDSWYRIELTVTGSQMALAPPA